LRAPSLACRHRRRCRPGGKTETSWRSAPPPRAGGGALDPDRLRARDPAAEPLAAASPSHDRPLLVERPSPDCRDPCRARPAGTPGAIRTLSEVDFDLAGLGHPDALSTSSATPARPAPFKMPTGLCRVRPPLRFFLPTAAGVRSGELFVWMPVAPAGHGLTRWACGPARPRAPLLRCSPAADPGRRLFVPPDGASSCRGWYGFRTRTRPPPDE
jgi:hypothetical protein